jgi:hypothetical protein
MTGPPVRSVEKLRIHTVQLTHAERKIPVRGFDEEMVVVVHETVGMTVPVVAFVDMLQRTKEVLAVLVILEHGLLFVATRGDVVDSDWVFDTKRTDIKAT